MRNLQRQSLLLILALTGGLCACSAQQTADTPKLDGDARLRVAEAADASGDADLAASMYAGASAQAPSDSAVQLRYADDLVRRGEVERARDLLLSHMHTVSDPERLRAGLAAIYVLGGEAANAIAEYDKLLAKHPLETRYIVDKGVALDLMNRHDEAQALYRSALAAAPNDPTIEADLALSLVMSRRTREAVAVVSPLDHADDVNPRVRNDIDIVMSAGGRETTGASEPSAVELLGQALARGNADPVRGGSNTSH